MKFLSLSVYMVLVEARMETNLFIAAIIAGVTKSEDKSKYTTLTVKQTTRPTSDYSTIRGFCCSFTEKVPTKLLPVNSIDPGRIVSWVSGKSATSGYIRIKIKPKTSQTVYKYFSDNIPIAQDPKVSYIVGKDLVAESKPC